MKVIKILERLFSERLLLEALYLGTLEEQKKSYTFVGIGESFSLNKKFCEFFVKTSIGKYMLSSSKYINLISDRRMSLLRGGFSCERDYKNSPGNLVAKFYKGTGISFIEHPCIQERIIK